MKFTIVTVCRNEAVGIRRTIESICSQTFQQFEWVVIDGGSTDGTVDELTKVKDRISTFISEEDSGVYNAMNKGLKHATSSYVIFMNGGDAFYDQNSLGVYNDHIGPDILYGNLLFTGTSERLKTYPSEIKKNYFLKGTIPHQACAVLKKKYDMFKGFDEAYKIAGDYDFFAKLFRVQSPTSKHINLPLARFDDSGISSQPTHKQLKRRENHRVKWDNVPAYRKTLKCWRFILKRCVGLA